jgi:hypothetical protein
MALVHRPDGSLVFVAGATRSGKTTDTATRTARDRRMLVWDAKGEWCIKYNCRRVSSVGELAGVASSSKLERIAYVVPVTRASFETFCSLAWVWLRIARGSLVVEELADVTNPGKAPPAWGEIVRKGLAYGPTIYALSQRPTESDTTAIGNATQVRCFQMGRDGDERYMARELRLDQKFVGALRPLQWIERDRLTKQIRTGSVKLRTVAVGARVLASARG